MRGVGVYRGTVADAAGQPFTPAQAAAYTRLLSRQWGQLAREQERREIHEAEIVAGPRRQQSA